MAHSTSLPQLGWSPFFQQQLSLDEWENHDAGRIVGHHRSRFDIVTEHGGATLPPGPACNVIHCATNSREHDQHFLDSIELIVDAGAEGLKHLLGGKRIRGHQKNA